MRQVGPRLYRCYICEQLNEERAPGVILPLRLKVYPRVEQVRKAALEETYERMVVSEERVIPVDPDFVEFLEITGTYGGPKNEEELRSLNSEEQQFYLEAYKEYLKEERKRKKVERLKRGGA